MKSCKPAHPRTPPYLQPPLTSGSFNLWSTRLCHTLLCFISGCIIRESDQHMLSQAHLRTFHRAHWRRISRPFHHLLCFLPQSYKLRLIRYIHRVSQSIDCCFGQSWQRSAFGYACCWSMMLTLYYRFGHTKSLVQDSVDISLGSPLCHWLVHLTI